MPSQLMEKTQEYVVIIDSVEKKKYYRIISHIYIMYGFGQLLSFDLENVISQGMKSLSEKQRLIDEALSQSYEIGLGGGRFGHCLV